MTRGAVIVIEEDKVALIRREREGHTYYLFPGGGVEAGETVEEAAIREAWEELGLLVRLDGLVLIVELAVSAEQVTEQYYFLAHAVSGTLGTGVGAELSSSPNSIQGSYTPLWIPFVDLLAHDVRPKELAQALASQTAATIADMAPSGPMRIQEKYLPPEQPTVHKNEETKRCMVVRVCAAIIRDGNILMVQHQHDGRCYWTLPGGGVEQGETPEEAAVREVQEETGLRPKVSRLLWEEKGICRRQGLAEGRGQCFLLEVEGHQTAVLGYDPEEAHLDAADHMLKAVLWFPLDSVRSDIQVAKVIEALGL